MTDPNELVPTAGECLSFLAEDGTAPVDLRVADGMVRPPQKQSARLYRKGVRASNEHRGNVYEEGDPDSEVT